MSSPAETHENELRLWQSRYVEARQQYKLMKQKNREQARRARQLLAAVKAKLQEKEEEEKELRRSHNEELTTICQHILHLQACLTQEQSRVKNMLRDKDALIQQQQRELDSLKTATVAAKKEHGLLHLSSAGTAGVVAPAAPVCTEGALLGAGTVTSASTSSSRLRGSFRQFKKEIKSQRQHQQVKIILNKKSDDAGPPADSTIDTSSSSSSSSYSSFSSEENSSPTSTPTRSRPPLRLSLSTGSAGMLNNRSGAAFDLPGCGSGNGGSGGMASPRKGILKKSSRSTSYNSLDRNATSSILENLQKLISNEGGDKADKQVDKASEKGVSGEEKNDSGRESEELEESSLSSSSSSTPPPPPPRPGQFPPQLPPQLQRSFRQRQRSCTTDSANSSFDGSEDRPIPMPIGGYDLEQLAAAATSIVGHNNNNSREKTKPKPPPRSSTTQLTRKPVLPAKPNINVKEASLKNNNNTTRVKIVNDQRNIDMGPESKEVNVCRKNEKRVKFHPELTEDGQQQQQQQQQQQTNQMEQKAIQLLEESIRNYTPSWEEAGGVDATKDKGGSGGPERIDAEKLNIEQKKSEADIRETSGLSYYEPYI